MSETVVKAAADGFGTRRLYIELLMKALTMWLWDARDGAIKHDIEPSIENRLRRFVSQSILGKSPPGPPSLPPKEQRNLGLDWPQLAHTMIGMERLENLRFCTEDVITQGIPGDLIETGVWRGGATILMRGILKAYGVRDRRVWVADSFEGLPPPDPDRYPADAGDPHHTLKFLGVSLEEVQDNFQKYDLLDDQVCFLRGWFKDTLPKAPIERLAVARLDGDMYESTMDALSNLYPKLGVGGYLIVDDYLSVPGCRQAVDDYRETNRIADPMHSIDSSGVFWQRLR